MTRKPRSDAKLLSMPQHQQDALATWLLDEGLSYADARERLHLNFNVVTSEAALSDFWRAVVAPRKLRRSASAASCLPELSQALEVDWEASTMALMSQKVFEMLADPHTSPESVFFLGQILEKAKSRVIKEKELDARIAGSQHRFEQKEREMALAREKFEHQKLQLRQEVDALKKSLASPDAPARLAKLVELIDAL